MCNGLQGTLQTIRYTLVQLLSLPSFSALLAFSAPSPPPTNKQHCAPFACVAAKERDSVVTRTCSFFFSFSCSSNLLFSSSYNYGTLHTLGHVSQFLKQKDSVASQTRLLFLLFQPSLLLLRLPQPSDLAHLCMRCTKQKDSVASPTLSFCTSCLIFSSSYNQETCTTPRTCRAATPAFFFCSFALLAVSLLLSASLKHA